MVAGAEGLHFDVVIVGGGPAGLAAGAEAARRGVSHLVLERGVLADTVVKYQKGKHVMAEPALLPLQAGHPLSFTEGTREEVLAAWTEGTQHAGTNLRCGPANAVVRVEGRKGAFVLTLRDGSRLSAAHVVLAIGVQGNPNTFQVPGAELPHVSYQLDDPGEHVGKRVVVVGVGDAGIENALALAARNNVSIVNRHKEVARAKDRNRDALEKAVAAERIAYYTEAALERVEPEAIVLATPVGTLRLEADLVIGRLGATPPREFLASTGITFASAVPEVSSTYESSVPGLYLIGTVGGCQLIKDSMNQGYEVIEHILGLPVEPADEALLRDTFAGLDGSVGEVLERMQRTIPLLAGLTTVQLREFLRECRVHRQRPVGAEVLNRRQFGESLYAVFEGAVDVAVPREDGDFDPVYEHPDEGREWRFTLGAGDFFGELSLLSDRRHSGTVWYGPGCVLIQMPRPSVIRLMRQVPAVRQVIDRTSVRRKLRGLVGPEVAEVDIDTLADAAVIETFARGHALFEQGAPPDGLHLIRRGSVMVSIRQGTSEAVVAYLPAGQVVGEMALLSPEARRSATVRATALTETLRVPMAVIVPFLERHRELRNRLETLESRRLVANVAASASRRQGSLVSFLIAEGAGEASDILLIDDSLCVRCDNCETACAATHDGISRLDREAGPTYANLHVPTTCRHCENPACMTDCPPDALRRHASGEVYILDTCIGCGNCERNCPYHVIQMAGVPTEPGWKAWIRRLVGARVETRQMAVKCDLCHGLPSGPACQASCPTGAVIRVEPKTYIDAIMPTT